MKKSKLIFFILWLISSTDLLIAQDKITTFVIVRHAEKATDNPQDPDLSPEGYERAKILAYFLKETEVKAIYSTNTQRTRLTAEPLGKEKGLQVQIYDAKDKDFLNNLFKKHKGEIILIIGHSNTIPEMLNQLAGSKAYSYKGDIVYDDIFVASFTKIAAAKVLTLKFGEQSKN